MGKTNWNIWQGGSKNKKKQSRAMCLHSFFYMKTTLSGTTASSNTAQDTRSQQDWTIEGQKLHDPKNLDFCCKIKTGQNKQEIVQDGDDDDVMAIFFAHTSVPIKLC